MVVGTGFDVYLLCKSTLPRADASLRSASNAHWAFELPRRFKSLRQVSFQMKKAP